MKFLLLIILIIAFNLSAREFDPFKASFQSPHQITLLNHGLGSLEERLQMIEKAQKTIDVEYFIYNLDKSGRIFSQALIKKAREGVKVRMLLDYFMIKSQFSPFFAHEMEKFGIEVKYFNVTAHLNLFSGQYRNHRKVLLVDGESAITGGRNIGDEYFDLREDYNFLDRDIFVFGPIVSSIQGTFDEVWNSSLSKKVERQQEPKLSDVAYKRGRDGVDVFRFRADLKTYHQKIAQAHEFLTVSDERMVQAIREKGRLLLDAEYSGSCENINFNSEYPIIGKKNRQERIIKHDISDRIRNSKESILFDSPYFIVNDDTKGALTDALSRNIKVELLTNSLNSTDAIYVYAAFDSIIKTWIKKGLEPHIYKGYIPENYETLNEKIRDARFGVHAKTFIFDNKDVVIGTYNFDPRSANYNTEMTVSCDDNPELAEHVARDIHNRMEGSIFLDSSKAVDKFQFYKIGIKKKIGYYLLKIPSNLLDYLL